MSSPRIGKSTGVISNAAITHATPAAAYANSVMRAWENDADMRGFPFTRACKDIAMQLIEKGTDINVSARYRYICTHGYA